MISADGDYELHFKLFAHNFPLVEFTVRFALRWRPPDPGHWKTESVAEFPGEVAAGPNNSVQPTANGG